MVKLDATLLYENNMRCTRRKHFDRNSAVNFSPQLWARTASFTLNSVQDQYSASSLCISEPLLMMLMRDKSELPECTWLSVSSCEYLQMNSPLGTSQAEQNHLGIPQLTQSVISTASPTIRNRYLFGTPTACCKNRESRRDAPQK